MENIGGNRAGTTLKSKTGWKGNRNGTDDFGFSALPGGNRYSNGSFNHAGSNGLWWTATENDGSYAYYRGMGHRNDLVYESRYANSYGLSVRCVRD